MRNICETNETIIVRAANSAIVHNNHNNKTNLRVSDGQNDETVSEMVGGYGYEPEVDCGLCWFTMKFKLPETVAVARNSIYTLHTADHSHTVICNNPNITIIIIVCGVCMHVCIHASEAMGKPRLTVTHGDRIKENSGKKLEKYERKK